MNQEDEPLTLREMNYDDARAVVRFVFMGMRNGVAVALSGFTPVVFDGAPSPGDTERSIRAAVKSVMEEAAASL